VTVKLYVGALEKFKNWWVKPSLLRMLEKILFNVKGGILTLGNGEE
jgi:hypothetical protein